MAVSRRFSPPIRSTPDGSPADKDATNAVERLLGSKLPASRPVKWNSFDPRPSYFKQLANVVDFDLLKKRKGKAVCDFVHGVGRGYLDHLLLECGWKVQ